MLHVDEAQKQILAVAGPVGTERINLTDALGRVLGEEIRAGRDQPPWDNSAMDGYAVRWDDVRAAGERNPARLRIVEEIPAGAMPRKTVRPGEASRIMTGAPMPPGADTVIRKEDTREESPDAVQILIPGEKGEFVRRRGMDVRAGSALLGPGTVIGPAQIGMLAAAAQVMVTVFRRPRVAILATGNELADLDEPLTDEKIMNTNSYALGAQVREAGGEPFLLGIARDTPADLRGKMSEALSFLGSGDLLISSGGVSVGKYDFIKEVYRDLGIEMKFWRVAMKPGSPLAFGSKGDRLVFGLPGNPVSAMVTFEIFVRPVLRKIAGASEIFRPRVVARLDRDYEKSPEKSYFLRGRLEIRDGRYVVDPAGIQDSGVLSSMLAANALIILPEGRTKFRAGDEVTVHIHQ